MLKFTFKQKFVLVGSLICLSLISIFSIDNHATSSLEKANRVTTFVSQIELKMLNLQRIEQAFLAKPQLELRSQFETNLIELQQQLTSIEENSLLNVNQKNQVALLKTNFSQYHDTFNRVA